MTATGDAEKRPPQMELGLDELGFWIFALTLTFVKGFCAMILFMPKLSRIVMVAILTAVFAALPMIANAQNRGPIPGLLMKQPPQKPSVIVFHDADGKQLSLRDFRGKLLLVNLWATWCVPCVKEMPSLSRLKDQFQGQNFDVIAINQDRDDNLVEPFYDKLNIPNLALYTDSFNTVTKSWDIPGLPASFIIDENGVEIARLYGAMEWDSPQVVSFLQNYLPPAPLPDAKAGM